MQEIIRLAQRVKEVTKNNPELIFERSLDKIYTTALTPIKKITLGNQRFRSLDKEYFYGTYYYNATWRSERAVEVPLLNEFLENNKSRKVMELGNVSAYYSKNTRPAIVVDKYERSKAVHNLDVMDIPPAFMSEGIASVSTLEHIGWDEAVKDPLKPLKCLIHLFDLVSDASNVLFTFPTGYNPSLDRMLADDVLPFVNLEYMERIDASNHWAVCDKATALKKAFGKPFYAANGLVIGRGLRKFDESELKNLKY